MAPVLLKEKITPAQLLARPDAVGFELVNGELVERHVGVLSCLVEGLIYRLLANYCMETRAGCVWTSSLGYRCFRNDPSKVRKPDTSFVRAERFSPEYLKEGYLSIAPDLAVEVVSPNDTAHESAEKVEDYLEAGVPLVWVAYPEARIIEIHRLDGSVAKLHTDAELEGENVLPGFRCRVESVFPSMTAS